VTDRRGTPQEVALQPDRESNALTLEAAFASAPQQPKSAPLLLESLKLYASRIAPYDTDIGQCLTSSERLTRVSDVQDNYDRVREQQHG